MKKKIIIVIVIVIAAILLIPIPLRLKDGGTVRYQAVLYSISDVHRFAPLENDVGYEEGIIIEILGLEVFNNVVPSITDNGNDNENPSVQVYDVKLSYANWTEEEKIRKNSLNAEKITQSNAHSFPIYKFETKEELEQFKIDFSEILTMDSGWDEIPSFNEVTSKYDNEFFEETTLFLVYIGATNSTHRFGLDSIGWDENSLYIQVEETTGAECVDCAMSGWFLTVAVSKASVTNCTEFNAVMGGIDLTLPTVETLRTAPKLIVNANKAEIEALKGTSSWIYIDDNGDRVGIMGDSNHPLLKEEYTPVLDLIPTYYSSLDPLMARLQFGVAPNEIIPDNVTVRCWAEEYWGDVKAESEQLPVTIENGNVFVRLKDGHYIYEVIAEWTEEGSYSGSVCYSFYTSKPRLE